MLSLCVFVLNTMQAQSNNDTKNTIKENPVLIGQQRGFKVAKSQLSLDPVLRMPDANKHYIITRYQISYLPKGKATDVQGPFTITGNELNTGAAGDILNKVQPGDRIFFEDIIAESPDVAKKPMKLSASVTVE